MAWAAKITAFSPAPHTLFIVLAPTVVGRPADTPHCLAIFCPKPADTTLPIKTSSMLSVSDRLAACTAPFIAMPPNSCALYLLKAPRNFPIGVLLALIITALVATSLYIAPQFSLIITPHLTG